MHDLRLPIRTARNLLDKPDRPGSPPWMLRAVAAIPDKTAPDGFASAVFLCENGQDAVHEMTQVFGPVVGGGLYQFTCYGKAAQRHWLSLGLWDQGEGRSGARVWFDLRTGTIGTTRQIGEGAARLLFDIAPMGDGWFRCGIACQISRSASTGMFTAQVGLSDTDGNTAYAGDGESGVLAWAPFVQYRPAANLLLFGDEIGTRPWVLTNAAARDRAPPVAGEPASALLRESQKPGVHAVRQAVENCAPGLFYMFSCLAKPAGRDWIHLSLRDGQSAEVGLEAWFDLRRGALGSARRSEGAGPQPVGAITTAADGWYRCTLSGPWLPPRNGATCIVQIALGRGEGEARYPGDGRSGVRLRLARLEAHAQPR